METEAGEGFGSRKRTNQNGSANSKGKRAKSSDGDVADEDQEPLNDDYTEGKAGKDKKERMWFVTGFDYERNLVENWVKSGLNFKHALVGFEVCPTTGKLHYHLCVNFVQAQRFAAVKKIFGVFGNSPSIKYVPGKDYARVMKYCAKAATKADPEKDVVSFGEYISNSDRNKQKCQEMNEQWEEWRRFAESDRMHLIPENVLVLHYKYYEMRRLDSYWAGKRLAREIQTAAFWEDKKLRGFQKYLWEDVILKPADPDVIHWVYDPVGLSGKSKFVDALGLWYGADIYEDEAQTSIAYSCSGSDVQIFDFPRAASNLPVRCVEKVNNGRIKNEKYRSTLRWFPWPRTIVFSNDRPPSSGNKDGFSKARCKVIEVVNSEGDYRLVSY